MAYEAGMFLTNYFEPPREVRFTEDEEHFVRTQQHPISSYINCIIDNGLVLKRVLELKPVELDVLSEGQLQKRLLMIARFGAKCTSKLSTFPLL